MSANAILLVDDEEPILELFTRALQRAGYPDVTRCTDSRQVLSLLAANPVDLVVLDLRMPHLSGEELHPHILSSHPGTSIVVASGTSDVDTAVSCMKAGAFDYLMKPVPLTRLLATVRNVFDYRELQRENQRLKETLSRVEPSDPAKFEGFVTRNPKMLQIFGYLEAIAPTARPVLITGETGAGKEIVAQALHRLSGRSGRFVALNMGGLDDNLFSDTLFGHVRGAYTGADSGRRGLLEEAAGGTLFLDEIGDLSAASQVRLLRLLQSGDYYSLGTDSPRHADVRVVAATNRDLDHLQQEGTFRSDLYYRLQIHRVHLPPLRNRLDDIPVLLEHFLKKAALELGKRVPAYPPELIPLLASYSFPGNVRELENVVFEAVSKHQNRMLSMEVFKSRLGAGADPARAAFAPFHKSAFESLPQLPTLREATQQLIAEALRRSQNRQTLAARLLGISQPALSKRLKQSESSHEEL